MDQEQQQVNPATNCVGSPPLLGLPAELRRAIFRFILVTNSQQVEVVSNDVLHNTPSKLEFYTSWDLSLLEVNKQVRAEGGDLFYVENVFTLKSYPRTQAYGQKLFFGRKMYHVDYARVQKAHFLSARGFFPTSVGNCILAGKRMTMFLKELADQLARGHCMEYLLIQMYEIERAPAVEQYSSLMTEINEILKPLKEVQGIKSCYIPAMKKGLWPYLRNLEKAMMLGCSDPHQLTDDEQPIQERALNCKEASKKAEIANAFGDPDSPGLHEIFRILRTEPLYRDLEFLTIYEDDNIS